MSLTEADRKRLKLQGISKGARHPMFQGRRKDVSAGNFEYHGCWFCGKRFPCELAKCNHAVFSRIGSCCDRKEVTEKAGKLRMV